MAVPGPLSSFLSTSFTLSHDDGVTKPALLCGTQGAATAVPRGHRTEVLLQLGSRGAGLTQTVLEWGGALMRFHGKQPTAPDANVHVERLGYSTVGHYFYGLIRGMNAEQTAPGRETTETQGRPGSSKWGRERILLLSRKPVRTQYKEPPPRPRVTLVLQYQSSVCGFGWVCDLNALPSRVCTQTIHPGG